MKRYMVAALSLLIIGGGTAAFFVVQHRNDVARAEALRKERAERVERAYRADVRAWGADDAAWVRANDAYEECKVATADAFGAADEIEGVVVTGGSREEFVAPIQDLGTEVAGARRALGDDLACLEVVDRLGRAQDAYSDATSIWLEWIRGDKYLDAENPDELPMRKHLVRGGELVLDAERALSDMEPGERPEKPERGGPRYGDSTPEGAGADPGEDADPDRDEDGDPLTAGQRVAAQRI